MQEQEVLFFAFANSSENQLPTLKDEDDEISKLLSPGVLEGRYILHTDSFTNFDKISYYLTLYRNHLVWFHYGGHAERDSILLDEQGVRKEGIGKLLQLCPKLKGVVLNGCCTLEQAKYLRDLGIPVTIGTSAPVGDFRAKEFAVDFYRALANGENVNIAFGIAHGRVLSDKTRPVSIARSLQIVNKSEDASLWCFLYDNTASKYIQWMLPKVVFASRSVDFRPNDMLLGQLYDGMGEFAKEIIDLKSKGSKISIKKKRMAILNSLPSPIAEHLRKLLVPGTSEQKSFAQVSVERIRQMVRSYDFLMKMITYTLFAQLWEMKYKRPNVVIPVKIKQRIRDFLILSPEDKSTFQYIYLIRSVRQVLDLYEEDYFIEELVEAQQIFDSDSDFIEACFTMELIKSKLADQSIRGQDAISELCYRCEQSLATIFYKLSFLAKYTLATIKNIDVLKYRHRPEAQFKHIIVKLIDLLGGSEEEEVILKRYMDARSVLLLKQINGEMKHLTISPFIIDENAFQEKQTEISKVHFFSHYSEANKCYWFQYVFKPEDELLEVSGNEEDDLLSIIKAQFDVFVDELLSN